jgi:diguanylate cyclase (GGDEF)-like protein
MLGARGFEPARERLVEVEAEMGRNAQKRLAKKLREDAEPNVPHAKRTASGAPTPESHDDDVSRSATKRKVRPVGPLWLRSTIVSLAPAGSAHLDASFLDLSLAAARGATLDELAHHLARKLPAEEILLSFDGDMLRPMRMSVDEQPRGRAGRAAKGPRDLSRGLAKRSGQEAVPGIEMLVTDELVAGDVPVVVDNVASDPRLPLAMGARARVGSLVAVPFVFDGVRLGFLAAARREVAAFPKRDVDVLTALALHLAQDLAQAHALRLAWTDPLTGMLSRQALVVLLEREVERARRNGTPLSVVLVDIDGLRTVNEAHGRSGGDAVLVEIAARAVQAARGAEVVGRIGSDKFLMLLDGPAEHVEDAVRRLLGDILDAPVRIGHVALDVRASLGVAALAPHEDTASLLSRAEHALAEAKGGGGGTVAFSRPLTEDIPRADDAEL